MRQFRLLPLLALLFSVSLAVAAPPELAPDHPERYVVKPGDTLWDIAGRFLRQPWRWTEIWEGNPQLQNPHLIYPGDVLYLFYRDGMPHIGRSRSDGPRLVKLSPGVRRESLTDAIPTIPIDAIQQFLIRPQVMSPGELEQAPRLIAFVQEHIVGGAGDLIYASSIEDDLVRSFDLVRAGEVYRDPDSGEVLGYEALHVGDAELLRPGTPAKLAITASARETQEGDRLVPDPQQEALHSFQPRPAPPFLEGRILRVLNGVTQIGQFSVVVLNRGEDDGLAPGDILTIVQRSDPPRGRSGLLVRSVRDALPLEEVGTLMVFRTFERLSYGLVLHATGPIHLRDSVRSPES
jgi:hypothetical protein